MNRRNVLIGLGGVVAGGGALLGTGAFTTVEAERTVSVQTAGDADAFLGISADPDYVDQVVTDDDDVFVLDIGGANTDNGGQGVNQRATTTFDSLVVLTNQGTQDVESISFDLSGDGADILEIVEDVGTDTPLTPGQETTFGVKIDLLNNDDSDAVDNGDINDNNFDPTVTITAEDA